MSEFTEMQQKTFDVLFSEAKGDLKTAMRIAGYAEPIQVTRFMETPKIKEELRKLTTDFIASTGPKAVSTIYGLLEGKGKLGDKEKLAAAKDLLDRADYKATERVEMEVSSPLFILPPKEDE